MKLKLKKLADKLRAIGVNNVKVKEPLSMHSSWKIGGPSDIFVEVEDVSPLQRLVAFAKEYDIPLI
ncbi:MAG: UDP-N-acetylenolpyruvoylglucosamine reductase, partial [Acetomicrobium sp.]